MSKKIRVVNICTNDYANFSYDNAQALCSVGIDAVAYARSRHPFGYTNQAIITSARDMRVQCERADLIQVMHADKHMHPVISSMIGKKPMAVWYTNTKFRQSPHFYSALFKDLDHHIIALGEFDKICTNDHHYVVGAINTDKLEPHYNMGKSIRVGHYPSNFKVKGTETVKALMAEVRKMTEANYSFNVSEGKGILPWDLHIGRISEVEIYIEMFSLMQRDKEYGSWGITALEAAALGKVVVTNQTTVEVYKAAYGDIGLQICNTGEDFKNRMVELVEMDHFDIIELQRATRQWVEDNHSYEATGNKLKEIYGI